MSKLSSRLHFLSLVSVVCLVLSLGSAEAAGSLGTAFTYPGLLKDGSGNPVTATCDFQFGLYDALNGGSAKGNTPQTVPGWPVTDGYFTVSLDFGANAFDGNARWLEISVRCPAGGGSYTTLSPRQPLTPAPYALALPGLVTQQNITSTNLIGGYSGNSITAGKVGAAIGGGGNSPRPNSVTADYGTVSGGLGNTAAGYAVAIGGGQLNLASGADGTIGGGYSNTVNSPYSTVGGGNNNKAIGVGAVVSGGEFNTACCTESTVAGGTSNFAGNYGSTVGGGQANQAAGNMATVGGGGMNMASGPFATVPGGQGAVASHFGEMAYSGSWFAATGDAQTSLYVLRRQTTNATPASLFLDGASQRLTIASGRAVAFDMLVVARSNTNLTAGYRIWGVIGDTAGTTTMIGASGQVLGEDPGASSWDAVAAADDTNDALDIRVTGAASTTIRWVAMVHTVEVAW